MINRHFLCIHTCTQIYQLRPQQTSASDAEDSDDQNYSLHHYDHAATTNRIIMVVGTLFISLHALYDIQLVVQLSLILI